MFANLNRLLHSSTSEVDSKKHVSFLVKWKNKHCTSVTPLLFQHME